MRLTAALLMIVFGMHYLGYIIATGYENQVAAARAWEYVLGGAGGALVLLAVGLLARRPVVWAVCLWGAIEDGMQSACRLAHPMNARPPTTETFSGLCGDPDWYRMGLIAAAVIAVFISSREKNDG
jgi:hypothetical protein